jgi:membrane-associated phospholipid phosphatase
MCNYWRIWKVRPLIDTFLARAQHFDLVLFTYINGFCGRSFLLDHISNRLEDVHLKGLLILGTFGVLWFRHTPSQIKQRETLVLILLSVVVSLVAARALAHLLPFRQRPMFTSGIGYREPLFHLDSYLVDWSSFPSDTAAVVFTLTTGFWLVSRWWGLLWACFAVIALAARVYFGIHYPGDILAGALQPPSLQFEARKPALFYGFLFPFLFEVSTLFGFVRLLRQSLGRLFLG